MSDFLNSPLSTPTQADCVYQLYGRIMPYPLPTTSQSCCCLYYGRGVSISCSSSNSAAQGWNHRELPTSLYNGQMNQAPLEGYPFPAALDPTLAPSGLLDPSVGDIRFSDENSLSSGGRNQQNLTFHNEPSSVAAIESFRPTSVVSGETANSTMNDGEFADPTDLGICALRGSRIRRIRPRSRPSTIMVSDPRPPHDFRALGGYNGLRNAFGLFECFGDCRRRRSARKGAARRGNLLAHLRKYHGQQIPHGG